MSKPLDTLSEAIAQRTAELVIAHLQTNGIQAKILLTPEEAAGVIGFTESAFNQAAWSKEIPVKKVGIQRRYEPEALKQWASNR